MLSVAVHVRRNGATFANTGDDHASNRLDGRCLIELEGLQRLQAAKLEVGTLSNGSALVQLLIPTADVFRARAKWRYTGQERPAFAISPGKGQISVWDFPRPPRIENVQVRLRVESGDRLVAETTRGASVLETAGAPTYYFPPEDVDSSFLQRTGSTFHCEWKGISDEITTKQKKRAGWVLSGVYSEFEPLFGWFAFYPQELRCFVDGEPVAAQPGGYYGGWVTADLVGPIKGETGSGSW